MNTYADKNQKTINTSVANNLSEKQKHNKLLFPFIDKCPETMIQRKLQEIINTGLQLKKINQLKMLANNYSNAFCQMKWIDDRNGMYYEWDKHLDGVQWYALKSDPEMMFFIIVDPEIADESFIQFAGIENAKHRSEWVELSGSDPYAEEDPSIINIPTEPELEEELETVKLQGQTLKPLVPPKKVYVLSRGRNDIAELMQYVPTQFMTEYIFDYENNIFATGERNPDPMSLERHPYIAREAGANMATLAGGMLRVMGDQIFTNEASGHYGENWTGEIREQFKKHVRSLFPDKPITHSSDFGFYASNIVK